MRFNKDRIIVPACAESFSVNQSLPKCVHSNNLNGSDVMFRAKFGDNWWKNY